MRQPNSPPPEAGPSVSTISQNAASADCGPLVVRDACHLQSSVSGGCHNRRLFASSSDFATDRGGNWVGSNSQLVSSTQATNVPPSRSNLIASQGDRLLRHRTS